MLNDYCASCHIPLILRYSSIGFIIVILMMINVAGPLIRTALEALMKWVQRARLLYGHMGCLAAPEDYNSVFRSRQVRTRLDIRR